MHEQQRIEAIRRFDLLGPEHREAFDRIARLASSALGVPCGTVSLVEADRIRFIGKHDLPVEGLDRNEDAFCHWVVSGREALVVPDALDDARFAESPLVRNPGLLPEGGARFFVGVPIVVGSHTMGAVCALGPEPRAEPSAVEMRALEDLAAVAARELANGLAHRHRDDLFTHALDGIFTLSADGTFLSLNPAFGRITGHDPERSLGRHFSEILHPDDLPAAREAFADTLRGKEVRVELRVVDPNGQTRPVDVAAVPRLVDGETRQVFGFARDMRDRDAAEERILRQSELLAERQEQLTRMARASSDALWDYDVRAGTVWWSEGVGTLFGYPDETSTWSIDFWEDRIHPDDRERVLREHHQAIANRETKWQDEYRYRCGDGSYKHVLDRAFIEYDEAGEPLHMYGGMVDITARKEAELALERSEEMFRSLYSRAPIGIYRTTPQGEVLLANDALVKMLGFDSFEELKARDLETEGYDPNHPRSEFRQRVENQAMVEGFEAVWRKRDGTPVVVREHARTVRDADGDIMYYEGTVEDVTEQRRFEDALRHLVELPSGISEGTFEQLTQAVAEALDTRWALFIRPTSDERLEVIAAHGADLPAFIPPCSAFDDAMGGSAVEVLAGLPFHCEGSEGFFDVLPAKAMLAVPVRGVHGDVVGAIAALHDRPVARPSPSARWLLTAFAQHAGVELEQLEHVGRLEATAHAADVLRTADSVQEVYRRATDEVLATTSAKTVNVWIYDEPRDELVVQYSAGREAALTYHHRLPRGNGVTWRVFESGSPVFVPDLSKEENIVFLTGRASKGAFAAAPLVDQLGHVFGALSADTVGGDSSRNLARLDLYYIEAMAQAIGVSVARLSALERARSEKERFRGLADLSARLELIDEPIDIARVALEALLPLTGFSLGSMWTVEDMRLRRVLSVGPAANRVTDVFVDRDMRTERGVLAEVIDRKEMLWIPEYDKSPHALPKYVESGLRSLVATPLMQGEDVYGVVVLDTFEETMTMSDETRSLLQAVAHRVQRALHRASSRHELVATREEALRALGLALEYRDYETKGHTDRVTTRALELGRALGLDDVQLKHLRWGAYLHDTGKVSIPDHILLKPGKLDPAEWRRMREHVSIGESMLRELGFIPQDVLDIVRHHHERFDGGGYPDGLSGDGIPLLARIFAVVDVFDALLSERPYKEAWLPSEALDEIAAQAGSQFDPRIAGVFLRLLSSELMTEESVAAKHKPRKLPTSPTSAAPGDAPA